MRGHRFFRRQELLSAESPLPEPAEREKPTAVMLGGRRYLVDTPYILPKDEEEARRIDFQHHLIHSLMGRHYQAPLPATLNSILDVGCGTGKWAQDMACAFPHAMVVGLDIEVPSPGKSSLPPNYRFVQGDLLKGLPFAQATFEFVHQRFLIAAIPASQWPVVVQELVRVTRPRGYVELLEASENYIRPGPQTERLLQWWRQLSRASGLDASRAEHLDVLLGGAWLRHVKAEPLQVPLGKWGGRMGELLAIDTLAGLKSLKGRYVKTVGVAPDAFDDMMATLLDEWNTYHTEYRMYVAYGQR